MVAAIVTATTLSSCLAWQPNTGPIERALAQGIEDGVRVTRVTGERHHLFDAHLASDSVIGVERTQRTARVVKIPVSEVQLVQTQRVDGGRTAFFFAVLVGVGLAALATISVDPALDIALQLR